MARYWTSDLHLGHKLVAELRGFDTIQEHDNTIMKQLSALAAQDEIWILGDISSGRPEGEEQALVRLISETSANLHLIAGNHDSASSIHRNAHKRQEEWLQVFESIQQFAVLKLGGKRVLMSHYPYATAGDGPERGPERYTEYRLTDAGRLLIHGHTHQPLPHMSNNQPRMYSVGWDAHRGLVDERTLTEWAMTTEQDT